MLTSATLSDHAVWSSINFSSMGKSRGISLLSICNLTPQTTRTHKATTIKHGLCVSYQFNFKQQYYQACLASLKIVV